MVPNDAPVFPPPPTPPHRSASLRGGRGAAGRSSHSQFSRSVLCRSLALPSRSHAQDFYKGKTITIICGYGVGGGYDAYARRSRVISATTFRVSDRDRGTCLAPRLARRQHGRGHRAQGRHHHRSGQSVAADAPAPGARRRATRPARSNGLAARRAQQLDHLAHLGHPPIEDAKTRACRCRAMA